MLDWERFGRNIVLSNFYHTQHMEVKVIQCENKAKYHIIDFGVKV